MFKKILKNHADNIDSCLDTLYRNAVEITVEPESPLVIFSDLHMGNGRKNDDFRKNAGLFNEVLAGHYRPSSFSLVLNGDIEELQKFDMKTIRKSWKKTYGIFDLFNEDGKLFKTIGNHDDGIRKGDNERRYGEKQAFKFRVNGLDMPVFVFHGHQASLYYRYLNRLNTILLRYIINPLGIRNFSNKFKHKKKMRIEKRAYDFSRKYGIISVIGHTHRPLFESLSRADSFHFSIENLLRHYRRADERTKKIISEQIRELKYKYDSCIDSKPEYEPASLMYSRGIPVPCLFNTGCTIGKRGITAIEITSGQISLVHWFDCRVSSKFLFDSDFKPAPLKSNPSIHRVVLRTEKLDYICDTINLLAGGPSEENISLVDFFTETKQNLTIPEYNTRTYGNKT